MKSLLTPFMLLLLYAPYVFATDSHFENHQNIKNEAHSYLVSKLDAQKVEYTVEIQNIDSRLKLKKCSSAIEINLTQAHVKPGKNTLNIQCKSSAPWRIFMTARVKIFSYALVSKHPLNKGHLIKEVDLKLEKIQLTGLRSAYLSDAKQAINHVLKRRVNRGDIISVNNLSKRMLIKKGDNITIIAKNNGFQIGMKGIALMAGSKGDKIKVKNIKTKKVIQGIIFDTQTVRVNI